MRSDYFNNLFYGNFKEATTNEVVLQWPAPVIRDVLSYLYTDKLAVPEEGKKRQCTPTVDRLTTLLLAADYLSIPALVAHVTAKLKVHLDSHLQHVCAVFQTAPSHSQIAQYCLKLIRDHPKKCLRHPAYPHADPANVHRRTDLPCLLLDNLHITPIINHQDIRTSERFLFETIFLWATRGLPIAAIRKKFRPDAHTEKQWAAVQEDPRWQEAKDLCPSIVLERTKPSFISEYVRYTNLVTQQTINDTYEKQALEAERGRPLYDNYRGSSKFGNGVKKVSVNAPGFINFTMDPCITDGRHEWTFKIITRSKCIWFGFCEEKPTTSMFAVNGNGWAYSIDGRVAPAVTSDPDRIILGPYNFGTIKLILNLTKTGTFTIVLNDKPVCLFKELNQPDRKFLPCVAVGFGGEVELIDERHLE